MTPERRILVLALCQAIEARASHLDALLDAYAALCDEIEAEQSAVKELTEKLQEVTSEEDVLDCTGM